MRSPIGWLRMRVWRLSLKEGDNMSLLLSLNFHSDNQWKEKPLEPQIFCAQMFDWSVITSLTLQGYENPWYT